MRSDKAQKKILNIITIVVAWIVVLMVVSVLVFMLVLKWNDISAKEIAGMLIMLLICPVMLHTMQKGIICDIYDIEFTGDKIVLETVFNSVTVDKKDLISKSLSFGSRVLFDRFKIKVRINEEIKSFYINLKLLDKIEKVYKIPLR